MLASLFFMQCRSPLPPALAPLAGRMDRVEIDFESGRRYPTIPLLRNKQASIGNYEMRLHHVKDKHGNEVQQLTLFESGHPTVVLNCFFEGVSLIAGRVVETGQSANCEMPGQTGRLNVDVSIVKSRCGSQKLGRVWSDIPGMLCFVAGRDNLDLEHSGASPHDAAVVSVYKCAGANSEGIYSPGELLAAAVVKDARLTLLLPHDPEVRSLITLCLLLVFALDPAEYMFDYLQTGRIQTLTTSD